MKVKRQMGLDCCQMDKTDPAGSRGSWRGIAGHAETERLQLPFDQGVSGQERPAVRSRALAARRAGTGMTETELKRLAGLLAPLQMPKMPLVEPPPRDSRFGSPLQLSNVHWVRPEVVVEVTYLTWTEDNLLRQVSYQGQREDKPDKQVVRTVPHPPRRAR